MADPVFTMVELPPTGSIDEQGYRTYRRTWMVSCSDPTMGPRGVAEFVGLNATGIPPGLYAQYQVNSWEIDLWARCKGQQAQPRNANDPYNWTFTADYDSKPFDFGTGSTDLSAGTSPTAQSSTDPTLLPIMVKSVTIETDIALTTDYSTPSKKVQASNGQAFSPAVTVKRYTPGVQITTYTAFAPWANKVRYTGAVNNDTFLGFAPNTLLCSDYSIQSVFQQNQYYYQIDITFLIADPESGDPDWDLRVLDCGTYERIGPSKPNEKIKDSQGNFVTDPVCLDGNGKKLPLGDPLVYLLFRGHKFRAFSGILSP